MIRSMTGFGRADAVVNGKKVTAELRSLNSKQLDLLLKMPVLYREKESELRQWIAEQAVRGKVEFSVQVEATRVEKRTAFDAALVAAYYNDLRGIVRQVDPAAQTDLMGFVLRMPDVTSTAREELTEEEWQGVMLVVRKAMNAFDGFRRNEGQRLHDDLAERTADIARLLNEVETLDAGRTDRSRERLRAKLADLQVEVNADRFEQELVYFLDKLDVNEEKVRLRAHCTYFTETLEQEEQQGRKLGFIAQEMGREINTLGAKANDADIQRLVVRMKDQLEKIKELVLNVL
jgi:uncharacterized protein (TIGR00255 family)